MTDSDRNLRFDEVQSLKRDVDKYRREVERTAKELTELRDAVRALHKWYDAQNWDARHPAMEMRRLRELVPPEVKA